MPRLLRRVLTISLLLGAWAFVGQDRAPLPVMMSQAVAGPEGNADQGKVKVTVGSKTQTFDISHVDSLWKMSFTLKDIFRFINDNMKPMEDTRDVEYAAVNGMLSKLDPHSVLLRP